MHPEIILTSHDHEHLSRSRRNTISSTNDNHTNHTHHNASWFLNRLWKNKRVNNNKKNDELLSVSEDECTRPRSPSLSPRAIRKFSRKLSSVLDSNYEQNSLFTAVTDEDLHLVEELISDNNHLDINAMKHPGISILHQACAVGNIKIVKLLIEKGANIYLKTSTNLSALKVAVLAGHYEVGQYLVSQGADPDEIKDGF